LPTKQASLHGAVDANRCAETSASGYGTDALRVASSLHLRLEIVPRTLKTSNGLKTAACLRQSVTAYADQTSHH